MVELVGARTDLRRVGQRWTGLCPFHDERTPSFSVNAEHERLPLLRLQRVGRRDRLRAARPRRSTSSARSSSWPSATTSSSSARTRTRRPRSADCAGSGCSSWSTARPTYYARVLWESPEAARRARLPGGARARRGGAARVPRRLLAERVGQGAACRAQRDGFARRGGARRRAGAAQPRQARHRSTASAAGSCSRWPTRAARSLGFGARAAARRRQRPEVPEHLRERALPQGPAALRDRPGARGRPAKAGRVVAVEGYTDVLALHQAGIEETVAIMGTAVTPEQLARAGAGGVDDLLRARRGRRRPGGDGARRAGRRGARPRAARGRAAARAATPPTSSSGTGPRRSASCSSGAIVRPGVRGQARCWPPPTCQHARRA